MQLKIQSKNPSSFPTKGGVTLMLVCHELVLVGITQPILPQHHAIVQTKATNFAQSAGKHPADNRQRRVRRHK